MELKRQCGQTACFHANRCRICLQRSGAQRPKPRRAFDEATSRHTFREERCAVFLFFVWRQTTPLFMRTTSRPHARARRGLQARACTWPWRMFSMQAAQATLTLLRWHASVCQNLTPGSLGANMGSFGSRIMSPVPLGGFGVCWGIFRGCVD